jgi:hypothetical protein
MGCYNAKMRLVILENCFQNLKKNTVRFQNSNQLYHSYLLTCHVKKKKKNEKFHFRHAYKFQNLSIWISKLLIVGNLNLFVRF